MERRCFEPTIPITNAELYDVVGTISAPELSEEGFTYITTYESNGFNSPLVSQYEFDAVKIYLMQNNNVNPIVILGDQKKL